ncbi:MAG: hypothetical protein ACI81O_001418 [Cyclobacteriaceae bacterium]|jgi:hypothetical protein
MLILVKGLLVRETRLSGLLRNPCQSTRLALPSRAVATTSVKPKSRYYR